MECVLSKIVYQLLEGIYIFLLQVQRSMARYRKAQKGKKPPGACGGGTNEKENEKEISIG